jgi:hypothetical protein
MSYRTVPNWPPAWTWIGGAEDQKPEGEVGTFKELSYWPHQLNKCFLIIDHERAAYMGSLLFDDTSFCREIIFILKNCMGWSIEQIGDLDVSRTL